MNKDFQFDGDSMDDVSPGSADSGAFPDQGGRSSPWWGQMQAAQQWQAQQQPLPPSPQLMPPPPPPAKKARADRRSGDGAGEGGAGDGPSDPRADQPERRAPVADGGAGDDGAAHVGNGNVLSDVEPAASEEQEKDPLPEENEAIAYETMMERYKAVVAECEKWRARNQQMQLRLDELTKEHDALLYQSNKLDDEIAEEEAKLERTRQREKAKAEELKLRQESVMAVMGEIKRREEDYVREVNSYCRALMDIAREARAAPFLFAPDNLERIIEEEHAKQAEIKERIAILDKELGSANEEFAKMIEDRNDLSVCTENNMCRILNNIIEELKKETAQTDAETEMLRAEVREVEAENAELDAQLQMMRDNPQLAVQARAAAIAAASTVASTSANSPQYYYYSTMRGREQGDSSPSR